MYIKIENGLIKDVKRKPVAGYIESDFESRAISNEHGTFLYKADGSERSQSEIDKDPIEIQGVEDEKALAEEVLINERMKQIAIAQLEAEGKL